MSKQDFIDRVQKAIDNIHKKGVQPYYRDAFTQSLIELYLLSFDSLTCGPSEEDIDEESKAIKKYKWGLYLDDKIRDRISGSPVFSKPECDHTWQKYEGLCEVYDFCTKCDVKRNGEQNA
jgi:hypothetical protein